MSHGSVHVVWYGEKHGKKSKDADGRVARCKAGSEGSDGNLPQEGCNGVAHGCKANLVGYLGLVGLRGDETQTGTGSVLITILDVVMLFHISMASRLQLRDTKKLQIPPLVTYTCQLAWTGERLKQTEIM